MKKLLFVLFSGILLTGCSDRLIESSISGITSENMTEPQTEIPAESETESPVIEISDNIKFYNLELPENKEYLQYLNRFSYGNEYKMSGYGTISEQNGNIYFENLSGEYTSLIELPVESENIYVTINCIIDNSRFAYNIIQEDASLGCGVYNLANDEDFRIECSKRCHYFPEEVSGNYLILTKGFIADFYGYSKLNLDTFELTDIDSDFIADKHYSPCMTFSPDVKSAANISTDYKNDENYKYTVTLFSIESEKVIDEFEFNSKNKYINFEPEFISDNHLYIYAYKDGDIDFNYLYVIDIPKGMTEPQTETSVATSKEDVYEIQTESATEIMKEEISLPENAVSTEKAAELLLNKLHNYGYNTEANQHLSYDSTRVFNFRPCYVFFSYDDSDDKKSVTGWYGVNPSTGECFDIVTEQLPLFYRFEITEYGVEVYEKYADEPFQILSVNPDFTPDSEWLYETYQKYNDPYRFIKVNDFDFDGYDDISVQVGLGATNATVQYYHYNPEIRKFENWNELNGLYYGVQADIKNETLSVHSKSSAVDAEDTVYKWDGDILIPVSMQKRYWNDNGIFMDYFEYDELGNKKLVTREQFILDENGDISETIDVTP